MKSCVATLISTIATVSLLAEEAAAVEHPQLLSTADFVPTWEDRPKKDDLVVEAREQARTKKLDHGLRPVIGVLTEPIRGDLYKAATARDEPATKVESDGERTASYIPRTHVQFLEQAGVRVVPIDHRLPAEEIRALLDQVNGLYMPGDSQLAITDEVYKYAFMVATTHAEQLNWEADEHFPLFMMGNALSTYVRSKQTHRGVLTDMEAQRHSNSRIDLLKHPDDTFFFNKMGREEKQAMFNTAQFFNMQVTGLRPVDLEREDLLASHIVPIATFTSHAIAEPNEQFIAIAEGAKMPWYAFTYAVEMVQFYFEDPSATLDSFQLDHSIIARKHAQTVASLIADECRLNDHSFDSQEQVFENLVRHEELVSVTYETENS